MDFVTKLNARVQEIDSLLCVGLDPHISQLSIATPEAAEKFCIDIINDTKEYTAAYKPNSAFFEALGAQGFEVLRKVIEAIPKNIPIILDNKRGDIDSTAQAYAHSSYEYFHTDSVTLSPYMGWDSLHPFLTGQYDKKGAFILCKTSNSSSKDVQENKLSNNTLVYEKIAVTCQEWAKKLSNPLNLGLVVGATDPVALKKVRSLNPNSWILCPGVGAQGGDIKSVCQAALRQDGSGVLINVSRAISKAENKKQAAKELYNEIKQCRQQFLDSLSQVHEIAHVPSSTTTTITATTNPTTTSTSTNITLELYQEEFIAFAIEKNVLQFGSFTLKSGRISPYFFNAGLFSCGYSLHSLGRFYAQAIHKSGIQFDIIFGPAYKGIPLAAAVSIAWYQLYHENKDYAYNRKEVKDHGEGGQLVGANMKHRRVLVVDDVITAGTAIRESVQILQKIEANLVGVAVCLDRQEKTSETINTSAIQQVVEEYHIPVMSVIQLKHLITHIESQVSTSATTGNTGVSSDLLQSIKDYRARYGVEY